MEVLDLVNSILLGYFVPLIIAYLSAKIFYSMEDEYNDEPSSVDVFVIVCPAVNVLAAAIYTILVIVRLVVRKQAKSNFDVGYWFLKIKKKED